MQLRIVFVVLLMYWWKGICWAQPLPFPQFNPDTILTFQMDTAVVFIGKQGLSEQDFIDQILTDTVFYQGFKKMKKYSFGATHDIISYNKKGKRTAHIMRSINNVQSDSGYKQIITTQTDNGIVYKKNGKYELFTVQMFSYIFESTNSTEFTDYIPPKTEKSEESYKDKLKTLIFEPGKPIKGVPFISSKTEIFSDKMRKYYDYAFYSGIYRDSIPVYRFKCTVKPEYRNSDKVMIRELTTTFDKRNFQILGRYIDMSYSNIAFDFDVRMNIEMNYVEEDLLPFLIYYDGRWDIPLKKPEIVSFKIQQQNFNPK